MAPTLPKGLNPVWCPHLVGKPYLVIVSKFGTILLLAFVLKMIGASIPRWDGVDSVGRLFLFTGESRPWRARKVQGVSNTAQGLVPLVGWGKLMVEQTKNC